MTTRFSSRSSRMFRVPGLRSGYEEPSSPDLTIPSCGIEDVDVSLFNLFSKEIPLYVVTNDESKRVPVIFAAGEKWAMIKKNKLIRDKNNTLILPLITIVRNTISQDTNADVTGRGINQQTGELVVKRRLATSDRNYQNLINKVLIPSQDNVALNPSSSIQISTDRDVGSLSGDLDIVGGGLLKQDLRKNVYEVLTLPTPQFYTATYEITIWTQYMQQMNQVIEALLASFLPQGQSWKLLTPKGYWFIASLVDGNFTPENNFSEMSTDERIIKTKLTVKVPAYLFANNVTGAPVPIKRFVSSPEITFEIATNETQEVSGDSIEEPWLGADDPTLPLDHDKTRRPDQRNSRMSRLFPNPNVVNDSDPALENKRRGQPIAVFKKIKGVDRNGNEVTQLLRVRSVNKNTGETVFVGNGLIDDVNILTIED